MATHLRKRKSRKWTPELLAKGMKVLWQVLRWRDARSPHQPGIQPQITKPLTLVIHHSEPIKSGSLFLVGLTHFVQKPRQLRDFSGAERQKNPSTTSVLFRRDPIFERGGTATPYPLSQGFYLFANPLSKDHVRNKTRNF